MNIVVADDEKTICRGTVQRLRRMAIPEIGHIYTAVLAEQALEIIRENRVHVLLTDIRMGEMDGLELIARAKAIQAPMVCVIITAYGQFQYAQDAIRLGVDDFLLKPCGEAAMRACVEKAIHKVNTARTYWEQQLEERLCAGLAQPDGSVRACFFQYGQILPEDIRVMVCRADATLPAAVGYRYASKDFCLVDGKEMQALCSAGVPVAFSDPGDQLHSMYSEACRRMAELPDSFAFLSQVDAYIDAHIYKDIDMASVANQLNLSYSYFSRLFRSLKGDTFNHYITHRRMKEACRLMREGVHVVEVADKLGYQNGANFIRAFRREFDLTPSQWLSRHPYGGE